MRKLSDNTKALLLSLVIVFILFGMNCVPEYSIDTYSTFNNSEWEWMLYGNGRIISALIYYIYEKFLNWPMPVTYVVSYGVAVLLLTLAIKDLSEIYRKYCDDLLESIFLSTFILANLFSIQFFLFIEMGLLIASLFFAVKAFLYLDNYWNTKDRNNIYVTLLFLFIAVFIYQTALGLFVILCIPFIIKHSDSFKSFVKNNCLVAGLYGFVMVVAWAITKFVLANPRISSALSYKETFINVFRYAKHILWQTFKIFPTGYYFLGLVFIMLVSAYVCFKDDIKKIYEVPYIFVVNFLASFALYFVRATTDYSPRIVYPYGALFALYFVNMWVNHHDTVKSFMSKYRKGIYVMWVGILLLQAYNFADIFIDRYKVNAKDKEICLLIGKEIDKYEKETGKTIKEITIYHDANITWNYPGLDERGFNTRAFVEFWSDVNAINCYLGKHYVRGIEKPEYNDYFYGKDWNEFSVEQLQFEDTTLHLCVY